MWTLWLYPLAIRSVASFSLPGLAPHDYSRHDTITMLVNSLRSDLDFVASEDYYHSKFGFCTPLGGPQPVSESLGSMLMGDRIYTSPYQFGVLQDMDCQPICTSEIDIKRGRELYELIVYWAEYRFTIDGLPVEVSSELDNDYSPLFVGDFAPTKGFRASMPYIYNHLAFEIEYRELPDKKIRVVGAQVVPHSQANKPGECGNEALALMDPETLPIHIQYSYSMKWIKSDKLWATRWDKYLAKNHPFDDIRWFPLVNSLVVVLILAIFGSIVLIRMVHKDLASSRIDEIAGDNGWKLLGRDVFRAPDKLMLYSIYAGTGAQVAFSIFTTVTISVWGVISPENRGQLFNYLLGFTCFGGAISGFVSAACYKIWGGQARKTNLLMTPIYVPLQVLAMGLLVNLFLIVNHSSGAVPFQALLELLGIWTGITVPLSILSGIISFHMSWPSHTSNQIPRQIPPQPWYLNLALVTLLGGLLGSVSMSVQVYHIYKSVWSSRVYSMSGFLFASTAGVILISTTFNALVLYTTLRNENYLWQWRSFVISGSPCIYLFFYSVYFSLRYHSHQSFQSKIAYFICCLVASGLLYLMCGFFGMFTSYFLVKRMYKELKED